jgi:hypothetical protein
MTYIKNDDGLLINTDESHYRALLAARESQKQAMAVYEQVQDLTAQLSEIKDLLSQAVNGRKYG